MAPEEETETLADKIMQKLNMQEEEKKAKTEKSKNKKRINF